MTDPSPEHGISVLVAAPDSESDTQSEKAAKAHKKKRQRSPERERERNRERRHRRRRRGQANQELDNKSDNSSVPSALPGTPSSVPSSHSPSTLPSPSLSALPALPESPMAHEDEVNDTNFKASPTSDLNPSQKREKDRSRKRRDRKREIERARDLLLFGCATHERMEIWAWSDDRVLVEASKLEEEILNNKDGEVWLVNLDRRQHSRTGDGSQYEGQVPDLSEDKLESERWTLLTHGTIYGYRVIDNRKSLVFAARFRPYDNMSPEELKDIEFLAQHFYDLGRFFNEVKNNGAKKGGVMFAEGWRAAYEALFRFGLYKLARNGKGSRDDYSKFLDDMERASDIYARHYQELAPREYLESCEFVEESCVPRFGTKEPFTELPASFGSNLTVTWGDFYNVYHFDNDASPRAFGSWFVTTDDGKLVTDPKLIRDAVKGGYFALPAYKLAVDFGACPGVVDLMWSSTEDLHATSESITTDGFRRIGTSIQVPKTLADAVARMQDVPEGDQEIAGADIRDWELKHGL
ncbi:hypothetical protein RSOLAG22IIIB_10353 [Rhizoctonia solani]|uniref:Tet-like 2OG-Fe(II) oxygenase domain-containing protein n=1 Tax=Rhizoctonia solani TaxID=456999 RepID=A0A0K6G2X4_9AGAM|nr:hypothetical protein RSOLAG22IIIB_10353 [Rhizoctonia solani]